MSPGKYEVSLTNSLGNPIDSLNDFRRLQYARAFNQVGNLSIVIPDRFAPTDIRRDHRIYVHRSVGNQLPALDTNTFWLVSSVTHRPDTNDMLIKAKDMLWILNRRIVGYTAQTPYADKTQVELGNGNQLPIDDLMKAYLRENAGSLVLTASREIGILTIAADRSLAPVGEKQASYQQLIAVFQDLASMSAQKGVPLYFDVRTNASGGIYFEVFADYLGTNRGSDSINPLIITEDRLNGVNLEFDYSSEVNYIFATGSGSGAGIVRDEDGDDERINASPWGAMEAHLDLRDADADSGDYIPDEIKAALYGGRPRMILTGQIEDGPGAIYGLDYSYGDRVNTKVAVGSHGSYSFDCLVNAVAVTVDQNRENIDAHLRGESIV